MLTHYGPVPDAQTTLSEAEEVLHRWVDVAERTVAQAADADADDVTAALAAAFATPRENLDAEALKKFEVLNGVHSNATGIMRYLSRRQAAPAE